MRFRLPVFVIGRIKELARKKGFASPDEYIKSLMRSEHDNLSRRTTYKWEDVSMRAARINWHRDKAPLPLDLDLGAKAGKLLDELAVEGKCNRNKLVVKWVAWEFEKLVEKESRRWTRG